MTPLVGHLAVLGALVTGVFDRLLFFMSHSTSHRISPLPPPTAYNSSRPRVRSVHPFGVGARPARPRRDCAHLGRHRRSGQLGRSATRRRLVRRVNPQVRTSVWVSVVSGSRHQWLFQRPNWLWNWRRHSVCVWFGIGNIDAAGRLLLLLVPLLLQLVRRSRAAPGRVYKVPALGHVADHARLCAGRRGPLRIRLVQ